MRYIYIQIYIHTVHTYSQTDRDRQTDINTYIYTDRHTYTNTHTTDRYVE